MKHIFTEQMFGRYAGTFGMASFYLRAVCRIAMLGRQGFEEITAIVKGTEDSRTLHTDHRGARSGTEQSNGRNLICCGVPSRPKWSTHDNQRHDGRNSRCGIMMTLVAINIAPKMPPVTQSRECA
jgi:hypothetical protein